MTAGTGSGFPPRAQRGSRRPTVPHTLPIGMPDPVRRHSTFNIHHSTFIIVVLDVAPADEWAQRGRPSWCQVAGGQAMRPIGATRLAPRRAAARRARRARLRAGGAHRLQRRRRAARKRRRRPPGSGTGFTRTTRFRQEGTKAGSGSWTTVHGVPSARGVQLHPARPPAAPTPPRRAAVGWRRTRPGPARRGEARSSRRAQLLRQHGAAHSRERPRRPPPRRRGGGRGAAAGRRWRRPARPAGQLSRAPRGRAPRGRPRPRRRAAVAEEARGGGVRARTRVHRLLAAVGHHGVRRFQRQPLQRLVAAGPVGHGEAGAERRVRLRQAAREEGGEQRLARGRPAQRGRLHQQRADERGRRHAGDVAR